MIQKTCSKCGETKPLCEFSNDKYIKCGKKSNCKECDKKYNEKNKHERNKKNRLYYKQNKKDRLNKCKIYYHLNKTEISERKKKYCKNNPTKKLERYKKSREYYAQNKHIRNEYLKKNKEILKEKRIIYNKSDNGKYNKAKAMAKRRRNLGYNPLNNYIEGCHGHHIDINHVIFIPKHIHKNNWHRQSDPKSMIKINKLALDFLINGFP